MIFNLYLPPGSSGAGDRTIASLIYLSGLTCTGDNCAEKGFLQQRASERGIAVIYPDTSPRLSQVLPSFASSFETTA